MALEMPGLAALSRPSGAMAMVAVDQRETMRAMFAGYQNGPVSDAQLVAFKLAVARALSPLASALLIDQDYAWAPALAEGAVAPGCGLICAVDRFHQVGSERVGRVELDDRVAPEVLREQGAKALKLLVIWRPDEDPDQRIALVDGFVSQCRAAGLISIIEPVSRIARDGRPTDTSAGILAAAQELGNRGQDLYKAEIPMHAAGDETEVRRQCAELNRTIGSPWVVLSAGVPPDRFPIALEWACREGASGFLAGRAVWRNAIGADDTISALTGEACDRLRSLCDIVDEAVAG
jgi:sulfofructosephosphate aldolase